MLKEEDAAEVVDFVAKGACQKVFAANLKRFAFHVLRFHRDKLRAHDVTPESRNGEAALFFANFALSVSDFRVRKDNFRLRIFAPGYIYHREAHAFTDLRRGQPHALCG